ncbi:MAG: DUF4974 domain-containing protein [Odoribacter sp.]
MTELNDRIVRLIGEYLTGEMDGTHREELMAWVEKKKENKIFFEKICTGNGYSHRWEIRKRIDILNAINTFDRRTSAPIVRRIYPRRWMTYAAMAASVVIILILSLFALRDEQDRKPVVAQVEITPGSSKAVLILSDGKEVGLGSEDSLNVNLGSGIRADNQGQRLVYEGCAPEELQYNELKTPRGGEYQVVLSDGSVIRLNSGSSLKYPVAFVGDKRTVELSGEAYFEVAKSTVPFLVKVGDITVKVYGTSFNINTHTEGRIRTALVEGKVGITVKGNTQEFILNPFQLADFDTKKQLMDIYETDITPYLAWTNGLFIFNNETLGEIMNTLSLWYDIDVFYQNQDIQTLHFTGCLKRYDDIGIILKALSQSVGIQFKSDGRTFIIGN